MVEARVGVWVETRGGRKEGPGRKRAAVAQDYVP